MDQLSLLKSLKYFKEVLTVASVLVAGKVILQWIFLRRNEKKKLFKKIEQKQTERDMNMVAMLQQIEKEEMSETERKILEMSLDEVLLEMKDKTIKCTHVLRAYQKKAYQVTKKLNCVVEFLLEAQEMAKQLDEHRNPDTLPLFGLPFSLKLNVSVAGHQRSLGYVRDFYNEASKCDAAIITALKNLGAVPFCITNLSQTIVNARTKNPIFGETLNPFDQSRTSGGSSGGEGALVGAGGSLAGLGTDMGGSVRIPAVFCGNVGFKPTGSRLSLLGIDEAVKGHVGLQDCPGFQCRDVNAIASIFKSLHHPLSYLSMQQEDMRLHPISFDETLYDSEDPLCIGYTYGWDDILPATPVAKRAVDETVEALKQKGHKLVRYDFPDPQKIAYLIGRIFGPDGFEQIKKRLRNDIVEDHVVEQFHHIATPSYIKTMLGWIGKVTNIQCLLPYYNMRGISTEELWDLQYMRSQYIQQVKHSWDEMNLDALIAPAYACPALRLEHAGKHYGTSLLLCQYTALYNLLDFPAGVVPVTKVNKNDLEALKNYPSHDFLLQQILECAPGSEGLPMSSQIVALRWKDEVVLRLMKEVEEGVQLL